MIKNFINLKCSEINNCFEVFYDTFYTFSDKTFDIHCQTDVTVL